MTLIETNEGNMKPETENKGRKIKHIKTLSFPIEANEKKNKKIESYLHRRRKIEQNVIRERKKKHVSKLWAIQ